MTQQADGFLTSITSDEDLGACLLRGKFSWFLRVGSLDSQ